jgi:hypothetical protein
MDPWILQGLIVGLITIVGYFLRQKDDEQGKKIDKLFAIHDKDVEKLAALELKIASDHYIKPELDAKFEKMEATFRNGFETLGNKFDRLSEILVAHVAKGDSRDGNKDSN